jgi:hypothetical protein
MGIFILLVVILLACLLVAGIALLLFSGQVYGQASRGAGGMAAECLATSAIEDAFHQLQKDVNDAASPLFLEVRRALLLRDPLTLDLTRRYPARRLPAVIARSPDRGFHGLFRIEGPQVVLRVSPETDTGEPQMLTMEAAAHLTLGGRSIHRRVRVARQVGITRVAPRRPLDQVPFAIVRTPFLADLREVAQDVDAIVRAYNRAGELLEAWKSQVEGKPLGVSMTATLPPLSVPPGMATSAASVLLFADQQYVFRGLWDEVEEAALARRVPPSYSVIFARRDEDVDLAAFHYYRRLRLDFLPLRRRLEQLAARFGEVMEPIEAAARSGSLDSATHSGWAARMGRFGRDLADLLVALEDRVGRLADHTRAHTATGITADRVDVPSHYASSLPIWPLAQHVTGGAAFAALLDDWPAVSGHVAVYDGPKAPDDRSGADTLFTLARRGFAGQAIVSLEEGGVDLGPVTREREDRDRLVVHADRVRLVATPIEAAVVVRERFETERPVTVRGSIVLLRYPRPPGDEVPAPWEGRVAYDPRLDSGRIRGPRDLSGVRWDHYVVSLNPRVTSKEVTWEP